jgi:hypothetical protein
LSDLECRRVRQGTLCVIALILPLVGSVSAGSVHAATPIVTITPAGARIQVVAASLSETIDALSRASAFKVTYEGARPAAMLYNVEIDTPSIPQTLFRLLEGQNLNYGVVLDPSGMKVISLLILGVAPKVGPPQVFATPRSPRSTLPPVDDDPEEPAVAEPAPSEPPSSPAPSPQPSPVATRPPPPPRSPFAPRPLVGSPFGPQPAPAASASPSA